MKIKKDKYLKARGSKYKLYNIHCSECGVLLFKYQKDGPGALKRCYLDRSKFNIPERRGVSFSSYTTCPQCKQEFGRPMTYKPENRLAIRLFVGAVRKKGVKDENK